MGGIGWDTALLWMQTSVRWHESSEGLNAKPYETTLFRVNPTSRATQYDTVPDNGPDVGRGQIDVNGTR